MAGTVNSQITDAVQQSNLAVIGEAPSEALGVAFQLLGQSVGLTMQNAVSAQQNTQTIGTTAVGKGVEMIMAAEGKGVR